MNEIANRERIGRTADGQTVVADSSLDEWDETGYDGIAKRSQKTGGSVWNEEDGNPIGGSGLRTRPSKRAWSLSYDQTHPASAYYKYDTPSATEAQTSHNRRDVVEMTHIRFETPKYVTDDEVLSRVSRMDTDGLSPYGGYRFLTFVAIIDAWGLSNEDVFTNEQLRAEFREEFSDLQVSTGKILRKAFEVRGDDE